MTVVPGVEGFLASSVTDSTGHGSPDCPWLLRAAPGQRVSITLIEFNTSSPASASHSTSSKPGASRSHSSEVGIQSRPTAVRPLDENEVDRQHQQPRDHHFGHHPRGGECSAQLAVIKEHLSVDSTSSAAAAAATPDRVASASARETIVCSSSASNRASGGGGTASSRWEKTVYLSTSNELEVSITRTMPHTFGSKVTAMHSAAQPPSFLLRFEGILPLGCSHCKNLHTHTQTVAYLRL